MHPYKSNDYHFFYLLTLIDELLPDLPCEDGGVLPLIGLDLGDHLGRRNLRLGAANHPGGAAAPGGSGGGGRRGRDQPGPGDASAQRLCEVHLGSVGNWVYLCCDDKNFL